MYSKILRKYLNICEIQIRQIRYFWHTKAVNGTRRHTKLITPLEEL